MNRRLSLHDLLLDLLGSKNVYFQPPATVKLKYPCLIYERDDIDRDFADNTTYLKNVRYRIKVIDSDPDSEIPEKIGELPLSEFIQHFTSDNLHHDVYTLYY